MVVVTACPPFKPRTRTVGAVTDGRSVIVDNVCLYSMYVYAMCDVVVVVYYSSAIPVEVNVAGVVDVVRIRVYRVSVSEMNL